MLATMSIGKTISLLRAERGLSQRDLAKQVGASPAAVAHWESGTKSPNVQNRAKLADALRVPLVYLSPEPAPAHKGPFTLTDPDVIEAAKILLQMPPRARQASVHSIRLLALMSLQARLDKP